MVESGGWFHDEPALSNSPCAAVPPRAVIRVEIEDRTPEPEPIAVKRELFGDSPIIEVYPRVRTIDVLRAVADFYRVTVLDICSKRRHEAIIRPRHVAMFLSREMTLCSLPEIGRRMGERDHTTVLHACRKIDGFIKTDLRLADEIEILKRRIQEAAQ